jgi:hypothetical protein
MPTPRDLTDIVASARGLEAALTIPDPFPAYLSPEPSAIDFLRIARAEAELRATPPRETYTDLPINLLPQWSVASIRSAVQAHNNGQFGMASLLVESMLADDRIQGALNGRLKGVTKSSVAMTPSEVGGAKRIEAATVIERLWPEMFPEEFLDQMLTWFIFSGFGLAEMIWEVLDGLWVPRLKVWHPLYIWYDVARRRYVVITLDAGLVYVEPNDPKWFLFTPYGSYRGWIRGAVRSCSVPWIVRQFALRDWARYSEVHGLPQKKVKYPAQSPAAAKAAFVGRIKNLGAETTIALPQQAGQDAATWDVELLEARDRSWEAFKGLIDQCDRSIVLNLRGTNLTTEVRGGSFAAAKSHREEDSDYSESDTRKFGRAARDQVLKPFCLYNYGDAALAPSPAFRGAATFEVTPSATETVVTVNEVRGSIGLGPLLGADGEERDEGTQTVAEFGAVAKALATPAPAPVAPTDNADSTGTEEDTEGDLPAQD